MFINRQDEWKWCHIIVWEKRPCGANWENDSHFKDLCNQIEKLIEILNQVMAANEKITSELVIIKNVNVNLENQIGNLEISYKPKLSSIIEGTVLKYQEFWTKYLMMILKTMLFRFAKIPPLQ